MASSQASLAILDDYANIAPKHFEHIEGLKIDSYPETLDAARQDGLEALVKRLRPYQILSTMRERTAIPAELQRQLPNLKLLLTTGMRNASIDLQCASDQSITVLGTKGDIPKDDTTSLDDLPPAPQFTTVNQHAWALLLSLTCRIPHDDHALKSDSHAWQSGLITSLGGKTLALAGLGKLGALMARTGVQSFGMKVIAWSENLTQEKADGVAEAAGLPGGAYEVVTKEELFRRADVLSVHYVMSARSRGVIGARELGLMKKSAVLVNTSRGPLIDEQALLRVVREGGIRGVALDVFWEEPLPADSPWRKSREFKSDVVLSPHMGYANYGTMNRWYQEQAENVERWMKGEDLLNKMN